VLQSYSVSAATLAVCAALLVATPLPVAAAKPADKEAAQAQAPLPRARHADGSIVRRGDTGGTVRKVQRALAIEADGVFGPRTVRAVKAFQTRARLPRSGKVDRRTWSALFHSVGSAGAGPEASGGAAPGEPAAPADPGSSPGPGSSSDPGSSTDPGSPATGAACAGTLVAPVRGTQTSGFGDGRNHAGIDLAAPIGTAVRAAACGTVNRATSMSGYGTMICIRHTTAFVTCYAHLSSMAVAKGAVVAQGQVIGHVGMTGRTTGPHLHFETRVNGVARDPEPYLAGARTIPGT
jgi:murein DD-endopeptidase MepM/ murein hydrolase activator NlpD